MPVTPYLTRSFDGATQALQLLGECEAGDLSFTADPTVGSFVNWPTGASGPFTIAIDQGLPTMEKIQCSAFNRSTGVFTVDTGNFSGGDNGRGFDDTADVDHVVQPNISQIILVWTAVEAKELNAMASAIMGTAPGASAGEVLTLDSGLDPKWQAPGGSPAGLMPIGGILLWATAAGFPDGFLACNGQLISRSTYSTLFSILGTAYGGGGPGPSTTFGLPNFNGKFAIGAGSDSPAGSPGGLGGASTIAQAQLPNYNLTVGDGGHSHQAPSPTSGFVTYFSPSDNYPATTSTPGYDAAHPFVVADNDYTAPATTGVTVASGGSGDAFYPPYLGMIYLMRCR